MGVHVHSVLVDGAAADVEDPGSLDDSAATLVANDTESLSEWLAAEGVQ
jgi:hypothetical protein